MYSPQKVIDGIAISCTESFPDPLRGYNDWNNIVFHGNNNIGLILDVPYVPSIIPVEPTLEELYSIKPWSPRGVKIHQRRSAILLSWIPETTGNIDHYNIYRSVNSNKFFLYDSISFKGISIKELQKKRVTYKDYKVSKNRIFKYYVTAVAKWGKESVPSETKQISF